MGIETTYLELSVGTSHKFYEVVIDGKKVTTRFGRIGDAGQSSEASFPTREKAKAEATKKANEKIKKGYAPAVMGQRAKRSVTRRSAMVRVWSSDSTAQGPPMTITPLPPTSTPPTLTIESSGRTSLLTSL